MTEYTVHVYREMRVLFTNVDAGSAEEAARYAMERSSDAGEAFEDCDGRTFGALVDVVGDSDYRQSRVFDADDGRLLDTAPEMLRALQNVTQVYFEACGLSSTILDARAIIALAMGKDSPS